MLSETLIRDDERYLKESGEFNSQPADFPPNPHYTRLDQLSQGEDRTGTYGAEEHAKGHVAEEISEGDAEWPSHTSDPLECSGLLQKVRAKFIEIRPLEVPRTWSSSSSDWEKMTPIIEEYRAFKEVCAELLHCHLHYQDATLPGGYDWQQFGCSTANLTSYAAAVGMRCDLALIGQSLC